jgi:hypothetical protein
MSGGIEFWYCIDIYSICIFCISGVFVLRWGYLLYLCCVVDICCIGVMNICCVGVVLWKSAVLVLWISVVLVLCCGYLLYLCSWYLLYLCCVVDICCIGVMNICCVSVMNICCVGVVFWVSALMILFYGHLLYCIVDIISVLYSTVNSLCNFVTHSNIIYRSIEILNINIYPPVFCPLEDLF